MRYLLGSRFWGLNTESSDKDYVEYLFPTKTDLFNGIMVSEQFKDKNGNDVNRKDVRKLLYELRRGAVKSFEVLYSTPVTFNDERFKKLYEFLNENKDLLLEELRVELEKAVVGEMKNRFNEFKNKKNMKAYVNFMKLAYVLDLLLKNRNPFKELPNHKALFDGYRELRSLSYDEFLKLYPNAFKEAEELYNRYYGYEFCLALEEKPQFNNLTKFVEYLVFQDL